MCRRERHHEGKAESKNVRGMFFFVGVVMLLADKTNTSCNKLLHGKGHQDAKLPGIPAAAAAAVNKVPYAET
jgi:hypothetical protein